MDALNIADAPLSNGVPSLTDKSRKERMIADLKRIESTYEKGDRKSTEKIAEHYSTALTNGNRTTKQLLSEGMPGMEDTDDRNEWICKNGRTFSNVQEAINYLKNLKINNKS